MIEVTESATQQIAEYFKGREVSPIRIFLNEGGWGGPSLAMALDEPNDTDTVYDIDGFKYIVNKDFLEKAQPIKVDFLEIGFKLTSNLEMQAGCRGCDTSSSCRTWFFVINKIDVIKKGHIRKEWPFLNPGATAQTNQSFDSRLRSRRYPIHRS